MKGPETIRELPQGWCETVPIFHDDPIPAMILLDDLVEYVSDDDLPPLESQDNKKVRPSRCRESTALFSFHLFDVPSLTKNARR